MKIGKIVGKIALGALVTSLIPYQFRRDEETGTCELRSLLWDVKKTPNGEKNSYTLTIPGPALDFKKEEEPEASPAEPASEEPTPAEPASEEPASEEPAEAPDPEPEA